MEEEDDGKGGRRRRTNLLNQYRKKCEHIYITSTKLPLQ
jgi:hypothetical protein